MHYHISFLLITFLSLSHVHSENTIKNWLIGGLQTAVATPSFQMNGSIKINGECKCNTITAVIQSGTLYIPIDGLTDLPVFPDPTPFTTSCNDGYFSLTISHAFLGPYIFLIKLSDGQSTSIDISVKMPLPQTTFNFVVSSNIESGSDSHLLDRFAEDTNANFIMILGNIHTTSANTDNEKEYLKNYRKNLFNNNKMKKMLQSKQVVYTFNDKDFAGGDKSNADSKGVEAINSAYRKIFPNYIEDTQQKGIYQSFNMAGVKFIMTDSRTFMDVDNGHLFGDEQTQWLKTQFSSALIDPMVDAIVITFTQPWNYIEKKYDIDIIKQKYESLSKDVDKEKNVFFEALKEYQETNGKPFNFYFPFRAKISSALGDPTLTEVYKPILLLIGEHHLAFDTGKYNNYGGFPMAVAGPIDESRQCRGGPYTHGSFHDSKHQYLNITYFKSDELSKGLPCFQIMGIIASKNSKEDQTVFAYLTCQPDMFQGRVNKKCPMDWKEKLIHASITLFVMILVPFLFFFVFYWVAENNLKFNYVKVKEV